jgi:hypothetical protein
MQAVGNFNCRSTRSLILKLRDLIFRRLSVEREMPMTLKTNEYMGVEGDRAFNTKERYRVDNLIGPTHH